MTTSQPLKQNRYSSAAEAIEDKIRYVQDFPEEGVLFEDLTPVLADAHAFNAVVEDLSETCRKLGADLIGGLDARGFLLGSAVAFNMGLGILAIRKRGKLPPPVHTEEYELEYGTAALEVPAETDVAGKNVVLVDDVLATGGTLIAARKLLEKIGADVIGNVVVLEVEGLGGREKLAGAPLVVVSHQDS